MLKKFPWKQRTKPRIPTTKNGKFIITFNVKYPDSKTTQNYQNIKQRDGSLECLGFEKIAHVGKEMVLWRERDLGT